MLGVGIAWFDSLLEGIVGSVRVKRGGGIDLLVFPIDLIPAHGCSLRLKMRKNGSLRALPASPLRSEVWTALVAFMSSRPNPNSHQTKAAGSLSRTLGNGNPRDWPTAFPTPSEAIDFACTVLRQRPLRIWIEGPRRFRMEQDMIMRNCEARGLS